MKTINFILKFKISIVIFILSLIPVLSNAAPATLIFNDGFESGNLDKHSPQLATYPASTFTVIKSPTASGLYAARSHIPFVSVSADNYRSETVMKNGGGNFSFNKEYWFSFKYRYEDWAMDSSAEMAPFQIHLSPSSWDSACATGAAWSNAPFYMWAGSDYMAFNTYKGLNRWKAPIQKNKWLTITVRYIPSWGNNGVIEAWFNGSKIVSVSGANQAQYDKCGLPFRPPYLKIGTYKWDWKSGRPATLSDRRTLLVDDIKIAEGENGYSLVTTGGGDSELPKDTTAPVISNVQANVSGTTAVIVWDTDEDSNSSVDYGPTTTYGKNASKQEYVKLHSVALLNLTAGATYHYRPKSADSSGNTRTGNDLTFTVPSAPPTADETAPVILTISHSVTDTTATITWNTNESANSLVRYGTTTAYNLSEPSAQLTTSHSITLRNLSPDTTIHYQVLSTDGSGNTANSNDLTLTTDPVAEPPPPPDEPDVPLEISNVKITFAATSAVVTWDTNKLNSGGKVLNKIACSSASYSESGESDLTDVLHHKATVNGLLPLTSYRLVVRVQDDDGTVIDSVAKVGITLAN